MRHHPRAVAVSARTRLGLDELRDAVIAALTEDFAEAEVETDLANGRLLAYLGAHAEISRQEFLDKKVLIRCSLPRYLLYHIEGPGVTVRLLGNGRSTASGSAADE